MYERLLTFCFALVFSVPIISQKISLILPLTNCDLAVHFKSATGICFQDLRLYVRVQVGKQTEQLSLVIDTGSPVSFAALHAAFPTLSNYLPSSDVIEKLEVPFTPINEGDQAYIVVNLYNETLTVSGYTANIVFGGATEMVFDSVPPVEGLLGLPTKRAPRNWIFLDNIASPFQDKVFAMWLPPIGEGYFSLGKSLENCFDKCSAVVVPTTPGSDEEPQWTLQGKIMAYFMFSVETMPDQKLYMDTGAPGIFLEENIAKTIESIVAERLPGFKLEYNREYPRVAKLSLPTFRFVFEAGGKVREFALETEDYVIDDAQNDKITLKIAKTNTEIVPGINVIGAPFFRKFYTEFKLGDMISGESIMIANPAPHCSP